MRRLLRPGVVTVLVMGALVALWEAAAAAGHVDLFFFSCPSLVWADLVEMVRTGYLQIHLAATVQEAAIGLLCGGALGTLTGLVLGVHPTVSRGLLPLMTGLNGVPKLALGPLLIIWFGIGLKSKALISGLMVFFVFAFNLYSGARSTDRDLLMGARLLGASHGQLLRLVVLPSCVPWFLTSLRTGLGMAFSGAIVGEYLGASRGLGWAITNAGERYDVARVLACVLVILCLVMLLGTILHLVERRLLRWRTVRGDGLGT